MSEKILKALLQLFAIIGRPEADDRENDMVVESFLKKQLNHELVPTYLNIYRDYSRINQKRYSETSKIRKRFSSSSVRVLKICTQINEELKTKQKIVVLIHLFEYIKADNVITEQELEFVDTVAQTFNISQRDTYNLRAFVLYDFKKLDTVDLLIIDCVGDNVSRPNSKKIISISLEGQIGILNIPSANIYIIKYLGNDEVYINGQILYNDKVRVLKPGSSIKNNKIIPIYYNELTSCFHREKTNKKVVFEAVNISYSFRNGVIGLHKMNFIEKSGQLVGIMGASGTGKSTLLNVLNGSHAPDTGEVLINGVDVHKEREEIEGLIGYVSQDDLLIEELTVFQNLYYNAQLSFKDLSKFQLIRKVLRTLKNLGLIGIKDMKIGSPLDKKISGGQRKRLNIALELLREPVVLFLDEPTSGLSSRDSENILDLLKEQALKGKLVFVVIHQPSSEIFKMFDKMLILDNGGYLIYNGDPVDSITYFKSRTHQANWSESECQLCGNVNPEQIFKIIEAQVVDEYGEETYKRKVPAKIWNDNYKIYLQNQSRRPAFAKRIPKATFKAPSKIKQFLVFLERDILSKLANKQYVYLNLLEVPTLAFTLSYILKYFKSTESSIYLFEDNPNLPAYIFISVIIAIFVGLTMSAQEILKDRKILKREAFLNLNRSSYLFSKITILLLISALQALLFVFIGNSIIEIKGMFFYYWLALFSTWSFAVLLGLNISDGFKSSLTVHIIIPFIIIPQIILSGVIVSYDKFNPNLSESGSIPLYGEIITARWAYEALAVNQFINNEYESIFYKQNSSKAYFIYMSEEWSAIMSEKVDFCLQYIDNKEYAAQVNENIALIKNEISKELIANPKVKFTASNDIGNFVLSVEALNDAKTYIDGVRKYYWYKHNKVDKEIDVLKTEYSAKGKDIFLKLKQEHSNKSLSDMLTQSRESVRIVEKDNQLERRDNPIYRTPSSTFLKAHFYSPHKWLFNLKLSTYGVNIASIWLQCILLYLALHFRLLKRLLDFVDDLKDNIKKRKK